MKRPSRAELHALLRKAHSLAGALPLAMFVVVHVWEHAAAPGGQRAYASRVLAVESVTGRLAFELICIYAPLLVHTLYGVFATFSRDGRVGERTLPALIQRAAGLVTLGFVAFHVWHLRYRTGSRPMVPQDYFFELSGALSSTTDLGVPAVAAAYLIGIAAVSYHLAYGLLNFCTSWGLTRSAGGARRAAWAIALFGLLLFAAGARTTFYFATGS